MTRIDQPVLVRVDRLAAMGLCVISVPWMSKQAEDSWKRYQTTPPTPQEHLSWFGNGHKANAAIVCGSISGIVVIDSDSPEAEAWCAANLPPTPMMTRTARGFHRYYRRPPALPEIPATIRVSDTLGIELKRDGQYVLSPGSFHPGDKEAGIPPGVMYIEVAPWPTTLDEVPILPMDLIIDPSGITAHRPSVLLPESVDSGSRNNTLFREGCKLRRLGYDETEIRAALTVVNQNRCRPPLNAREVETIAHSCVKYDPAADTYPLTEAGDAEFFTACYADQLRFNHRIADWFLFLEHHWVRQNDGQVHRLALDAIRARQRAAVGDRARLRWAAGGEARKRQTNLLALAQNMKPLADAGDQWDTDLWLLGVRNGVIDLRTGRLRPGEPDDRITRVSPVAYDPGASTARWSQFILDICNGDTDLAAFLQRSVGYALTGDTSEQCFWILYGTGANGKSTFLEILTRHVLPEHSWTMNFPSHSWSESMSEYQRAQLDGRRLIIAKESEQAKRLNTEFIKSLTGGDTVNARHPYGRPFTYVPQAKFYLAVNHKPIIRDDTHGMWRRVRLVPFERTFPVNPAFAESLTREAPAVLTWAVDGVLAYQRLGLMPPVSVTRATQEYRQESDVLAEFFAERCVFAERARTQAQTLFQSYRAWCDICRLPEGDRLGQMEFGKRIAQDERITVEKKRPVMYLGIGLMDVRYEDKGSGGEF